MLVAKASPVAVLRSRDRGAATSVWAATASALEGQGGKCLEDCQIIGPWTEDLGRYGTGYGAYTYDEAKARKLWEMSLE